MTDVRTLSTEDLRQRLGGANRPQFFWNVQTDQFFTGELIPGSRHVSLDTIADHAADIPNNAEIVTYCGGPQCPQSRDAARRLMDLGYTNVRAYTDGLEGWRSAGYETVQVPQPTPAA